MLEQRIEELTRAVIALTERLNSVGTVQAPTTEPKKEVEPAPVAPVAQPAPSATLDEVKNLALAKVKEGKATQLKTVLGNLGVSRVTELKPEQYAQAKEAICSL